MEMILKSKHIHFDKQTVESAVKSALISSLDQAMQRRDYYAHECKIYELARGISSEVFLQEFEAGKLGDDEDLFNWYAAQRAFTLWQQRTEILGEVLD